MKINFNKNLLSLLVNKVSNTLNVPKSYVRNTVHRMTNPLKRKIVEKTDVNDILKNIAVKVLKKSLKSTGAVDKINDLSDNISRQAEIISEQIEKTKRIIKTVVSAIAVIVLGLLLIKLFVKLLFKKDIKFTDLLFFRFDKIFEILDTNGQKLFVGISLVLIYFIAYLVAKGKIKIGKSISGLINRK